MKKPQRTANTAKGNRTKGPRAGRPKLSEGKARVKLSTSIAPESRDILDRLGGPDGVTIDTALGLLDQQIKALADQGEAKARAKAMLEHVTIRP